ncbi:MAG: hypothetical protein LUE92_00995 [Clostridiales bacterium]|nr:hypothetical protein [Clostridiales bacterium]
MIQTFRISFSLKNTYRVNKILYALKHIPLIRRLLPDALYSSRSLKNFANVLSILTEIFFTFFWKVLYFLLMVWLAAAMVADGNDAAAYLHILVCLTAVGAFINRHLMTASWERYYGIFLMRMDARKYTVSNHGYAILRVIVGFLPMSVISGVIFGTPVWTWFVIPVSVAGAKLAVDALCLVKYERRGGEFEDNPFTPGFLTGILVLLMLAAAYLLPYFGVVMPPAVSCTLFAACIPAGILGIRKILAFDDYLEINRQAFASMLSQTEALEHSQRDAGRKALTDTADAGSDKNGFEYLNELFVKRHKKILWKFSKRITWIILLVIAVVSAAIVAVAPDMTSGETEELFMGLLPATVFILYLINRGTSYTQALFVNCDHSLLTYSFFKNPDKVLCLFRIRLRELIKINIVPAAALAFGLSFLFYLAGGSGKPVNYVVIIVSVLCESVFFSLHYLTLYYLFQPYDAASDAKGAAYKIATSATYVACFVLWNVKISSVMFGVCCILFCVVYFVVASILVYRFAPKTFRLRV